jgi:putrescine transport system ATP-binding protein
MTLASRVAVMDGGRFVQIGTPTEVYEFPCSRFVADFFGTINLFSGHVTAARGGEVEVQCDDLGAALLAGCQEPPAAGAAICIAVRPEKIAISREPPSGPCLNVVRGKVWDLAYYGNRSLYHVKLPTGRILQVTAQNRVRSPGRVAEWDDEVYLCWDSQSCVLLRE